MPKRTLIALVAIAALALLTPYILLFGTMTYDDAKEYLHREPFDSKAWQDPGQVEGDDPVRLRMVDDLIRSKRLDHLPRADVEALLGKPSATEYFRDHNLVYWLGPERGWMSVDSEWLAIDFDENGMVRKYQIVRD